MVRNSVTLAPIRRFSATNSFNIKSQKKKKEISAEREGAIFEWNILDHQITKEYVSIAVTDCICGEDVIGRENHTKQTTF